MKILSHYGRKPNETFSLDYPAPKDNGHNPGGLWLSDDSDYGWAAFVQDRVLQGSMYWSNAKERWRYKYDFTIDLAQSDCVLTLATPKELQHFTLNYGEASPRECVSDGRTGYGIHIEWQGVKADYKGILITPYQGELSYINGDPMFHWYRFDCACGCFWDISCLVQVSNDSGSRRDGLEATSDPTKAFTT